MLVTIIVIVLMSMGLLLARCITGETTYDRILAANSFGTKTVMLIALLALMINDAMLLDVALLYALINFIATIAFLKYFKDRSFSKE